MTPLERLEFYLIEAIKNTGTKRFARVSAALVAVLPELVTALSQVTADPSATPSQRLRAAEMLMSIFGRCIQDQYKKEKVRVTRDQLKIQKNKALADDKRATLAINREREEISKKLEQATKEIGG